MNQNDLKFILNNLYKNKLSPEDALKQLKSFSYENMGFAKIDHNREVRSGIPEVIYSKGKSVTQIKKIIASLSKAKSDILATKLSADAYKSLKPYLPKKDIYNKQVQILIIRNKKLIAKKGLITIVTAGTSDIPIAQEAVTTADLLGSKVETIFDVGVAGLHRLLDNIKKLSLIHI